MFTTTLVTLAAAAALNAQGVSAPAASQTTINVASPQVTAVSTAPAKPAGTGVRIPGTFDVSADPQDLLDGVHALYLVRSGDGA